MRILIVKLSSLGDVVHAMPVVHDIGARLSAGGDRLGRRARLRAAAAPDGRARRRHRVPAAALDRQLVDGGDARPVARLPDPPALARLRRDPRPAGPDQVGADRASRARRALRPRQPHRGREPRVAGALAGRPRAAHRAAHPRARSLAPAGGAGARLPHRRHAGLRPAPQARRRRPMAAPTLLFIHGTSRDDKLWPEADWIALGRRAIADGWRIALPQAGRDGAGARTAPASGTRRVGQRSGRRSTSAR